MVQEFHVVRCFSCQSFQVQQVKKASRWTCKLCGEKQSLLKEFGRGSAADCRRHVQKLNAKRGAMMEEQECKTWSLWKQVEGEGDEKPDGRTDFKVSCSCENLDKREEAEPKEEEEEQVVTIRQLWRPDDVIDRKRKRKMDDWTPEQSNWPSLVKPGRSGTTSPSSTSQSPSTSASPVSRWTRFLTPACQVTEERAEPAAGVGTLSASPSSEDIIHSTPPLNGPHVQLPVSSMFESGDDFSFDEFLTDEIRNS